ncbi:MAG: hypothetical protein ABIA63_15615, partial [bacterium]
MRIKSLWKIVLAIIIGLFFLFPLLWMFQASFLPDSEVVCEINSISRFLPEKLDFQNYKNVFERVHFIKTMTISAGFILVIVLAGLFFN